MSSYYDPITTLDDDHAITAVPESGVELDISFLLARLDALMQDTRTLSAQMQDTEKVMEESKSMLSGIGKMWDRMASGGRAVGDTDVDSQAEVVEHEPHGSQDDSGVSVDIHDTRPEDPEQLQGKVRPDDTDLIKPLLHADETVELEVVDTIDMDSVDGSFT